MYFLNIQSYNASHNNDIVAHQCRFFMCATNQSHTDLYHAYAKIEYCAIVRVQAARVHPFLFDALRTECILHCVNVRISMWYQRWHIEQNTGHCSMAGNWIFRTNRHPLSIVNANFIIIMWYLWPQNTFIELENAHYFEFPSPPDKPDVNKFQQKT